MFSGLITLILLVFGGYLAGVAGFFMAISQNGRSDRIENRLEGLERRQREIADEIRRLASGGALTRPAPVAPAQTTSQPMKGEDVTKETPAPVAETAAAAPKPIATPTVASAPSSEVTPTVPTTAPVQDAAEEPAPWKQMQAGRGSARRLGFEENLGTKWAVWVGGLALGLGAVLLVRYSIEQGMFGPGARILMGTMLAAALVAGGEWLRRGETKFNIEALDAPYIPGVLTAAGTVAAFATVYSAYAVYGFIGPGLAFVLLGLIGLGAIFAATVHGPRMAGLGLAGSMLTPLLVSSISPDAWPAVIYLGVVSAAAQILAQRKNWRWLSYAATAGALIWGFMFADQAMHSQDWLSAAMAHTLLQLAIATYFFAYAPLAPKDRFAEELDVPAIGFMSAFAVLALVVFIANAGISLAALTFAALIMALLAAAGLRNTQAAPSVAISGLLSLAAMLAWPSFLGSRLHPVPDMIDTDTLFSFPLTPMLFVACGFAAAMGLAVSAARRLMASPDLGPLSAASYAGTAAVLPLVMLTLAFGRLCGFQSSLVFASAAISLAGLFAFAASTFQGIEAKSPTAAIRLGTGALAAAAVAAVALGLVFYLDRGYLTVALAITAFGTAFMAEQKKVKALRYAVIALGICVLARIFWDPLIMGDGVGTTPIFNWLLFGYGVPAISFFFAARLLRKDADDEATHVCDALALIFAALLAVFEIRHWLHNGDILARSSDHVEQGLLALTSMAFSYGLMQSKLSRSNIVFETAALVFAGLSAIAIALGLGIGTNPYFTDQPVMGGGLVNSLWLGYLIPSMAAAYLARQARGVWPDSMVAAIGALALALVFAFVSLSVRHAFHGANDGWFHETSDAEFWTYSVAWLALGIALLGYGLWRNMAEARLASAALVGLTVLKVFLWDMAGLGGALRAFSFIGLGIALLGIGLVYQRFVFGAAATPGPSETPT